MAGLLQACGADAPPRKIYVLGDAPVGQPRILSRLHADMIEVRLAQVPDYLDTTDIATRGDDGSIVASRTGRWGERLSVGVTRAVASVLADKLPNHAVVTTSQSGEPRWRIWIDIDTLEVRPKQGITLAATWRIVDHQNGKADADEREVLTEQGTFLSDPEIVSVVDHEVTQVAEHISAALGPLAAAPAPRGKMQIGSR